MTNTELIGCNINYIIANDALHKLEELIKTFDATVKVNVEHPNNPLYVELRKHGKIDIVEIKPINSRPNTVLSVEPNIEEKAVITNVMFESKYTFDPWVNVTIGNQQYRVFAKAP